MCCALDSAAVACAQQIAVYMFRISGPAPIARQSKVPFLPNVAWNIEEHT